MHPLAALMVSVALTALTSLGAPPAHADASCNAVYDAGIKQMQTPHRIVTTTTTRSKTPVASETIFAGGVVYLQHDGRWKRSTMTAADMLQRAKNQRSAQDPAQRCRLVGAEAIDGVAATRYDIHTEAGADSKVWISTSDGALLRQTVELPNGASVDMRTTYGDVRAPAPTD